MCPNYFEQFVRFCEDRSCLATAIRDPGIDAIYRQPRPILLPKIKMNLFIKKYLSFDA